LTAKVSATVLRIHLALPSHFVTVNDVDNGQKARDRYRRELRKAIGHFEECLVYEVSQATGGLHSHSWVRTARDTETVTRVVQEAAQASGAGDSDVRPVTHHGGLAYPFKTATGPLSSDNSRGSFLAANQGRLFRTSRGFFRD
jgi:hypothetical protein